MRLKLSLRKKVIIQIISPTLITINMAIIRLNGKTNLLSSTIIVLAVVFYLFMLYSTYRKNCEPEDEMARRNQQRADSLSFNMILIIVTILMLYGLVNKSPIVLSETMLLSVFAGMNILSVVIFLFYDIRGN